ILMSPFAPDVIVVGAGSAGCALTRRLVDGGVNVLLLEAGGADESPAIHDPARFHELWLAAEDWAYYTTPPGPGRRPLAALAAGQGAGRLELPQRAHPRARRAHRLRGVGAP